MDYKIKTLAGNINVEKEVSLIATVGDIRVEKEMSTPWINIFLNDNSDIGYSFVDQVELKGKDDIKNQDELVAFAMNWYFENVEVVTQKQNEINIQKAKEYRENLEEKKLIETLSKYKSDQLFEELEKRGYFKKTRILGDKEAYYYLVLEEIKSLISSYLGDRDIKSIDDEKEENEIVINEIKRLIKINKDLINFINNNQKKDNQEKVIN